MTSGATDPSGPGRRTGHLSLQISELEIPPAHDVLLVGREAPVGAEAVRRMVDAVSPDLYKVVPLDHPLFEAVVFRRALTSWIPKEQLISLVVSEGEQVAIPDSVLKVKVSMSMHVQRIVEL